MTARHCSRCSKPGHNFRTCGQSGSGGGVKLFGVQLTDGAGCFTNCATTTTITNAPLCSRSSSSSASFSIQRKKAAAWSEEEHRRFLVGLKKLGKGNWRGIAYNHVFSRTPTQVASHAQKYFLRQNDTKKRRRRSSLFDIGMESERKIDQLVLVENEQQPLPLPSPPTPRGPENSSNQRSCPQLSLDQEPKPSSRYPISQAVRDIIAYNNNNIQLPRRPMLYPVMLPVFYPYCPAQRPTSPALPNESRIVDDRTSQGPELISDDREWGHPSLVV